MRLKNIFYKIKKMNFTIIYSFIIIISIILLVSVFFLFGLKVFLFFAILSAIAFLAYMINVLSLKKLYTALETSLLNDGHFNEQHISLNPQINKIYKLFQKIARDKEKYFNLNKQFHDKISESFQKINTLSTKSFTEMDNIFCSIDSISEPIGQQEDEVENTLENIENLSKFITNILKNYKIVLDDSKEINKLCNYGVNTIETLKLKFHDIANIKNEILKDINSFNLKLKNMDKLLKLINEMSKQMKLLSINTSIEANKMDNSNDFGFIVIANNFNSLSSKTVENITKIKKLIQEIFDSFNIINESTHKLNEAVNNQNEYVEKTEDSFKLITNSISSIHIEMSHLDNSLNGINKEKVAVNETVEKSYIVAKETIMQMENFAEIISYHVQTVHDIFAEFQNIQESLNLDI